MRKVTGELIEYIGAWLVFWMIFKREMLTPNSDENRGTNSILASCKSCTKNCTKMAATWLVFFSELEWCLVRNNIYICLVIWMVMDYYINQLKCEWVWFWNIKHIWETSEVLNASFSVALLLHRKNIGHNISNNTSIWDVSDDLFGGKRNQISRRFKQMSCKTSAKYSIDAEFLPVLHFFTPYLIHFIHYLTSLVCFSLSGSSGKLVKRSFFNQTIKSSMFNMLEPNDLKILVRCTTVLHVLYYCAAQSKVHPLGHHSSPRSQQWNWISHPQMAK